MTSTEFESAKVRSNVFEFHCKEAKTNFLKYSHKLALLFCCFYDTGWNSIKHKYFGFNFCTHCAFNMFLIVTKKGTY